uniref:Uncharacterized protein n=1 Tax=Candidatus Kentrum sp. MB TaxID=2138164 RepID=A0A450XDX9_9GAMM|nr:MAG: hypothetical protein BECKMB1821G_GA0114241_102820 [Candidatus Kentron sp. MB]VFK32051.1 MAG: hypothetical protein BECKMB1821I_GA0114274_102919 [Candidatus Kentron sp. MB]VFK75665.1 MAG: hypothetical protein BECKMB1821H_GA0114242_102829 [Candidatus Kentron sp. MB]
MTISREAGFCAGLPGLSVVFKASIISFPSWNKIFVALIEAIEAWIVAL